MLRFLFGKPRAFLLLGIFCTGCFVFLLPFSAWTAVARLWCERFCLWSLGRLVLATGIPWKTFIKWYALVAVPIAIISGSREVCALLTGLFVLILVVWVIGKLLTP